MKAKGSFEEINRVKVTCGNCGVSGVYLDIHKARSMGWQIEWRPKPHIFCREHNTP